MAAFTLTKNLRLKISSGLTADALYNLNRIDDAVGSLPFTTLSASVILRGKTDVSLEPQCADLGGSGNGGNINLGLPSHNIDAVNVYSSQVNVLGLLGLKDRSSTKYLNIKYDSALVGAADTVNRELTIDVQGANRSIVLGGNLELAGSLSTLGFPLTMTMTGPSSVVMPETGTLVTLLGTEQLENKTLITPIIAGGTISNAVFTTGSIDTSTIFGSAITSSNIENTPIGQSIPRAGNFTVFSAGFGSIGGDTIITQIAAQQLSNKTLVACALDGSVNTVFNIGYGSLLLANSIKNSDVADNAGIAYSKLALTNSIVDADIAAGAMISGSKITPDFSGKTVTTQLLKLFNGANFTSFVNNPSLASDLQFTLPANYGNSGEALVTNGAGALAWMASAGGTQFKISFNDSTQGYADDKLLVGSGLSKVKNNAGGNETLTFDNADKGSVAVGAHNLAFIHSNIPTAPANPADNAKVWTAGAGSASWVAIPSPHDAVTIGTPANGLSVGGVGGQELTIVLASASTTGALSDTDWSTFNGKQVALTIGNIGQTVNGRTPSDPLFPTGSVTVTGGTGAVIGAGVTFDFGIASGVGTGLLSSSDFVDFSSKQPGDATLTALAALDSTVGIVVETAADTFTKRTITGTANRLAVSNGDGVAANPTINVDTTLLPSPLAADVGKTLVSTAADSAAWGIPQAIVDGAASGLVSWGGAGNYYTYDRATGIFSVLRPGVGRLNGTKITWAGGETVAGLVPDKGYLVGYSATNTLTKIDISTLVSSDLQATFNLFLAAYTNNTILFGIWTDGANPRIVKEDHNYSHSTDVSVHEHFRLGQTFTFGGAQLSVLSAAGRTIQTSGEDMLDDHGLTTRIPDATGAALDAMALFQNNLGVARALNRRTFTVSGITTAPTVGATYTNNSSTFTVMYTNLVGVAPNISGTIATWTSAGNNNPLASGTLTKTSGTGDATIAFSAYAVPSTISTLYAPGGIPTSLTTGGGTRFGIVAIYASKDDKQTPNTTNPAPIYYQILSNTAYSTANNAANSIGTGTTPTVTQFIMPNEMRAIELVLNGFVLVDGNGRLIPNNNTNGFVAGVKTVKQVIGSATAAGAVTATTANNVSLDTTNFNGILSVADVNVQLAMDTLDDAKANRYNTALSWSGAGPYTMTITGATHGKGVNPIVRVRETVAGVSSVVETDVAITDASGDVLITSVTNFTGNVTIL